MAFSFLDTIGTIAGLIGQHQSNRAVKQNNVATKGEKQSQALYAALADPNSPLLQQMSAQERNNNLSAFQQQITQMQLADRRAQSMGRSPTFFNPERADEAVSYLTSRGLPAINAQSKEQAMARILQAAQGMSGAVPQQANRNMINMQRGVSNASYNSQVPQQLLSAFGYGQQSAPMTLYPSAQDFNMQHPSIHWG